MNKCSKTVLHILRFKNNYAVLLTGLILCCNQLIAQLTNKPTTATQVSTATPLATPAAIDSVNSKLNYIRIFEAMAPITNMDSFMSSNYNAVKTTTRYMDGLGRDIQTVIKQGSPGPNPHDIVSPVIYDAMGRPALQYQPYVQYTGIHQSDGSFKYDAFTSQQSYYANPSFNQNPGLAGESVLYSKTVYEPSPMERVLQNFAPGNTFAGSAGTATEHAVQQQYLANNATDSVRYWTITDDTLTYNAADSNRNLPTSPRGYDNGTLYKLVTADEQGNKVVEYKDFDNRVVLKKVQLAATPASGHTGWLCTYYVYDDMGRLRFVLSPKAVALAASASWTISAVSAAELCFRYEYDERQRTIAQKIPGAGWVYLIYDKRNRLCFSQDAAMLSNNQWLATLYDGTNRIRMTGMFTYSGNRSQLQLYTNDSFGSGSGSNTTITVSQPLPANLVVPQRVTGVTQYKATSSITFTDGFDSEVNGEYETFIDTGTVISYETVEVHNNPMPAGNFIALTITYYDDYSFTSRSYSTLNNSKLSAGNNPYPDTLPTIASIETRTYVTGTKVRVLQNPDNLAQGMWLETTNFYDGRGRLVQVQSDNYRSGKDTLTTRYNFAGLPIATYLAQGNPAAGVNLRINTAMEYDHGGRLLAVTKTINDKSATTRTISRNEYTPLGQLKQKLLGQQVLGGTLLTTPLDTLSYRYNLRGWLTGINKEYANTSATTSRWFGMDLSYDWGFDSAQYNGNISGLRWRSRGDGQLRSYGFGYDKSNRLLAADFNQYTASSWNKNAGIDFSVRIGNGVNGVTGYDENGNLLSMMQKGLGNMASMTIDSLSYSYYSSSNKLRAVSDPIFTGASLGDFTDRNTNGDDYGYNDNGNLVTDRNKYINGGTGLGVATGNGAIRYNHLNLPYKVNVQDNNGRPKGYVIFIYDAVGNKLQKIAVDSGRTIVSDYIGGALYDNDTLQLVSMEEGRMRPSKVNNTDTIIYDYFVKDHLGNVRMILTDQEELDLYPALTFEDVASPNEQVYYDKANVERVARPSAFYDNSSNGAKVQLLRKSTRSIGAGKLMKVMVTDKLHIKVDYYMVNETTDNSNADGTASLLTALTQYFSSAAAPAPLKGNGAAIISNLSTSYPFTSLLQTQSGSSGTTLPKAYLNILFFDEQFRFVQQNSELIQVTTKGSAQHLYRVSGSAKEAPANGYVYIYVSNESNNLVYFDNLQITHERGRLLEENHYYPFGLTMSGISSKALGFGTPNKIKYNGYEANDFLNLNIFESFFRIHDPQLGRFWQIDPKPSDWESPFAAMGNNPVLRFDVLGDTIGLGNLYEKDKNGTYKNSNEILAFELYASTGAGKKYLLDHAEKGFNLKGALVKDLNINAKSEGKSSANGVDIGLAVVPHISGGDAKTDDKIEGGRLKISFQIEKSSIGESLENKQIYRDNMLKKVDSWTHEFLLHGDLLEKRFLNGSSIKPYSHSNESLLASKYYSFGIQVLQDVQNLPVGMNKGLTPHSANYLYNSIMMPGLGHLVPPLGSSKY